MNKFIEFRQRAIDWLNGKRDFDSGIAILEASKFKPGVVAKLKRHGVNGPSAPARLKFLMRDLVQAWSRPEDKPFEDVDPDTGLDTSIQQEETHDDVSAMKILDADLKLDESPNSFPQNASVIIRKYSAAYKKRDMLHKKMAALPEDNNEETMKLRAKLSDEISATTDLMERLYPLYQSYSVTGEDISDESMKQLDEPAKAESSESEDDEDTDYSSMSKEELQKLRKSVATKIARAKNMLEYQKETKGEVANPLPESPKRAKYEAKIAKLTAELEKIEYQIATFG